MADALAKLDCIHDAMMHKRYVWENEPEKTQKDSKFEMAQATQTRVVSFFLHILVVILSAIVYLWLSPVICWRGTRRIGD
jgi:hypothetical protein